MKPCVPGLAISSEARLDDSELVPQTAESRGSPLLAKFVHLYMKIKTSDQKDCGEQLLFPDDLMIMLMYRVNQESQQTMKRRSCPTSTSADQFGQHNNNSLLLLVTFDFLKMILLNENFELFSYISYFILSSFFFFLLLLFFFLVKLRFSSDAALHSLN
ncbi:hypothetical protein J6590_021278 [Homalodisca vitripennis]|nr:hypothetical protein J6590_021278 [Homalodisca vitripennis]